MLCLVSNQFAAKISCTSKHKFVLRCDKALLICSSSRSERRMQSRCCFVLEVRQVPARNCASANLSPKLSRRHKQQQQQLDLTRLDSYGLEFAAFAIHLSESWHQQKPSRSLSSYEKTKKRKRERERESTHTEAQNPFISK